MHKTALFKFCRLALGYPFKRRRDAMRRPGFSQLHGRSLTGRCVMASTIVGLLFSSRVYAADILQPLKYELAPKAAVGDSPFTIERTIDQALKAYPQIEMRWQQVLASKSRILLTREQEYMPKALSTYEEVAASHNKLTQILFGDPVLPPNPGPGLPYQTWHGNFFSGAGFLLDWNPIDFGLHKAKIDLSKSQYEQQKTSFEVTRLDVATAAANDFLNVLVAQEQVHAAESNVKRMQVVTQVVGQLVTAGLKPAMDMSLAEAQLAAVRNTLIRAEEQEVEARSNLATSMGIAGTPVKVDPTPMETKESPPVITVTTPEFAAHPLSLAQRATIASLGSEKVVLAKSIYPNLRFLGGMNWRGSGLSIRGKDQSQNFYGLAPQVYNWNVGFMFNWGFLDWIQIHQQKVVQDHLIKSQQAQYQSIIQSLRNQDERSRAMLDAAIKLTQNTPIQLAAAKDAEARARARYEAGLGTIEEIAESERMLSLAEVEDSVAKIGVWKALLAISNNHGNINGFVAQVAAARANKRM